VTSYKLIASDSVEEKVLRLQSEKRKLLEDVFDASEAANASLGLSDLKELI
jgi:SNF2 family DNA or RNA helicase